MAEQFPVPGIASQLVVGDAVISAADRNRVSGVHNTKKTFLEPVEIGSQLLSSERSKAIPMVFACPISMFRSRGFWDRQSDPLGFEVLGLLVHMIITLAAMTVKDKNGSGAETGHTQ